MINCCSTACCLAVVVGSVYLYIQVAPSCHCTSFMCVDSLDELCELSSHSTTEEPSVHNQSDTSTSPNVDQSDYSEYLETLKPGISLMFPFTLVCLVQISVAHFCDLLEFYSYVYM